MARPLHKLNDIKCKAASKPGRHGDGGGLYLDVKPSGAKSWVFVWTANFVKDGKTARRWNEMGLGAYPTVSLAAARKFAVEHREAVQQGRNPIAERQKEAEPTFAECVDKFLDEDRKASWRNEKHRAQWEMTLGDAYCKHLRPMRVSEIGTDDVLKVLKPVWQSKPETASRTRGRIERVLSFAKGKGWRSGENPAVWRGGLDGLLPVQKKLTRGHHKAMAYADVPAFVQRLRGHEAMSARALEFLIFTAARSGEVLEATWGEFDLDVGQWTVPAHRMKAGREHRVPLSKPALTIVKSLYEVRVSDYVFPGHRKGRPLSNMAFAKLMERMKVDNVTPHGFRSAFRDWAGDATSFPRDVAEQALAHRVGDATEQAYRRSDALEKRRKLMDAWAGYSGTLRSGNVVKLERKHRA